jgi:uncharacterized phage-associated protein
MVRQFDVQKAIQAAGELLRFERNRMSYLRLLKLLYLADREAIRERGLPILGSRAVAMESGPLHSDVYSLVKGIHESSAVWSQFFSTIGYQVETTRQPENGLLSPYEINKLRNVSEKYAPFTDVDICREMTHSFDEWSKNYQEGTSRPITLEDIIDAVGRRGDKRSILEDVAELEEFDKLISQV